jgi:hypothetical protein
MRDFVVRMSHRPGELARVTNALSLYGVNIKSVAAMTFGDQATLHFVPDDVESARSALKQANIPFEDHELAIVLLENRAGELTAVASKLAEAGINLDTCYVVGLAEDMIELAIVSSDVKKAKKVLE